MDMLILFDVLELPILAAHGVELGYGCAAVGLALHPHFFFLADAFLDAAALLFG
jgi:hypothetical protein